jgi:hypothetical protein
LAAAAAWKFLKFSPSRRRRGCIYFLSAAAAWKFLKFSPSPRGVGCIFLGKIGGGGGGSADRLTPLLASDVNSYFYCGRETTIFFPVLWHHWLEAHNVIFIQAASVGNFKSKSNKKSSVKSRTFFPI